MQHCRTVTQDDRKLLFGRFMVEDILLGVVLLVVGFYGIRYCLRAPSVRLIVYLVFSVAFAVSMWALARFGKNQEKTFFAHKVFPIVFSLVAILGLVFFPPCTAPDERTHFLKSYVTANIITPGMDEHDMREEDVAFTSDEELYNTYVSGNFWKKSSQLSLFASSDAVARDYLQTAEAVFDISIDLPQLKLPSALGIMVGRSLGLSGVVTYYLGRLFNALYAVALIVLAVRMAPVGKNAIIAASLLPMSLHLIGSYSYDAGYIALGLLETGLLLRLLFGETTISPQLMVGYLVTGALLAPGKLVYALLSFCAVIVPSSRFSTKRVATLFKVGAVFLPILGIAMLSYPRIIAVMGVSSPEPAVVGDGLDHRGLESGHFYTVGEIVTHPLQSFVFLLGTFQRQLGFYLKTMLGGILGWIQWDLSTTLWEDVCMFVPLVLGMLRSKDDEGVLDRVPRIGFCLTALLGVGAIMLSMWVSWTFTSDECIQGVQGRYFLPFLPMLLLAIRPSRIQIPVRMAPSILLGLSSFACFYWAQICYLATV